jgi:prepilin-type N-terminal cleavage/methylation domain-containing protein
MQRNRTQRGFSLLEIVIVIVIGMVVASVSILGMRDAMRSQKAERALQDVLAMTRTARQLAIDKRRVFMVTYSTAPSQMTLTVTAPTNSSGGCAAATAGWPDANPALPTPVIGNYDFAFVTGAPNSPTTSPDGLAAGKSVPIYFTSTASPSSVCFYPDGSARDLNNAFTSGVLYLAPTTVAESNSTVRLNNMRAVTIFGPTGRISGWRLSQTSAGRQWKMW